MSSLELDDPNFVSDVTREFVQRSDAEFLARIQRLGPYALLDENERNPGGLMRALRRQSVEFPDFQVSVQEADKRVDQAPQDHDSDSILFALFQEH